MASPFYGANKSTRNKLQHCNGGVESFTGIRAQSMSGQIISGETVSADVGSFASADFATMTVAAVNISGSITVPAMIVNGGADEVILAPNNTATTGPGGIVVGDSTTAVGSTNTINIGQNNVIATASNSSIVIGQSNTVNNNNNIVIGTGSVNNREYGVLIGFGTSMSVGDNVVAIGHTAISSGGRGVSIGFSTSSVGTGVAIGDSSVASYAGSVALGSNVQTRNTNEFSVAGLRIIRAGATTGALAGTFIPMFTFQANGEVVGIEATALAHNDDVALGSEVALFRFDNYLASQTGDVAVVSLGTDATLNPTGLGALCGIGSLGAQVGVTVNNTEAVDNISWTIVFRVWGGPIA